MSGERSSACCATAEAVAVASGADGALGIDLHGIEGESFVRALRAHRVGSAIAEGEPLLTLELVSKVCDGDSCTYVPFMLECAAPYALTVTAVNDEVAEDPALLDERPGVWVVRVRRA
jgi:glycine cleavage system H lipoate-binding protein